MNRGFPCPSSAHYKIPTWIREHRGRVREARSRTTPTSNSPLYAQPILKAIKLSGRPAESGGKVFGGTEVPRCTVEGRKWGPSDKNFRRGLRRKTQEEVWGLENYTMTESPVDLIIYHKKPNMRDMHPFLTELTEWTYTLKDSFTECFTATPARKRLHGQNFWVFQCVGLWSSRGASSWCQFR